MRIRGLDYRLNLCHRGGGNEATGDELKRVARIVRIMISLAIGLCCGGPLPPNDADEFRKGLVDDLRADVSR